MILKKLFKPKNKQKDALNIADDHFLNGLFGGVDIARALQDQVYLYLKEIRVLQSLFPARLRGDKGLSVECRNSTKEIWEDIVLEFFIDFFDNKIGIEYITWMADLGKEQKLVKVFCDLYNGKDINPRKFESKAALFIFNRLSDFKDVWNHHKPFDSKLEYKICSDTMMKKLEEQINLYEKPDIDKYKAFSSIVFEEVNFYAKDIALVSTWGIKPYDAFMHVFNKTVALSYKKKGYTDDQIAEKRQSMLMCIKNAVFPDDLGESVFLEKYQ